MALLLSAAPASAEWYRASSEHFLIYSEQSPDKLRPFAEDLEKFDGAARAMLRMEDLPISQGNRVTIFMVKSVEEVQRLEGDKSGLVYGFYKPSAAGSVAFVPHVTMSGRHKGFASGSHLSNTEEASPEMGGDIVLLHEYSHHLIMQDLDSPYPQWLSEGIAEFMSTAQFEDGVVGIGLPAGHRYYGLLHGERLSLETLMAGRFDRVTDEQWDSLYGQGWLLTHYLIFDPSRKGQLRAYVAALAKGVDGLDAAHQAFGDLDKLYRDMTDYLHRASLPYLKVSGAALNFAPIQITTLSSGGSAVLPLLVELKNGVPKSGAGELAARIAAVGTSYPGDELVETTRAEAELEADHAEAAEAASDRALKTDPRSTDALVLKGRAMVKRASKLTGAPKHALYEQARNTFIDANAIDREDPEPLYEFYYAFALEGITPTANAIAALHYASDLAPQDAGVRLSSALQYLSDGQPAQALRVLPVVAYNPHDKELAPIARRMIDRIRSGDIKGAIAAGEAGSEK